MGVEKALNSNVETKVLSWTKLRLSEYKELQSNDWWYEWAWSTKERTERVKKNAYTETELTLHLDLLIHKDDLEISLNEFRHA